MSVTEQLVTTAGQVEGLRDGLGRIREVLDQTDSVLDVADAVLEKADEVLGQAAEAVQQSRRWAPRIAIVVGVFAVAAIGAVIVMRVRSSAEDE